LGIENPARVDCPEDNVIFELVAGMPGVLDQQQDQFYGEFNQQELDIGEIK
jgi:hypothetical protein